MNSINSIKSTFIRKRGNNYNVIIEYYDNDNKIKQKSIARYTNKKEAEKHLIDLKSSINNNSYVISKDITFVDRYKKYIEDEHRHLSPGTIKIRKSFLKNNIEPFFKDIKLCDVSPYILQEFANYVYKNYSKGSAQHRLASVKTVLTEAYRLKEIQENPCNFVKSPKSKVESSIRIAQEPYSKEEVKHLIENLDGVIYEIPILLMLTCGLRYGEMAGLRWQDIDFNNNTLTVNQVLIYTGKEIIFKKPKTEGSIRTISVPYELISKLKKWKIKHNKYKLEGILEYEELVCLNSCLRPVLEYALLSFFKRFTKKIGLRSIRLHDLRHTHATILILAGTDFKTISHRLGHTDIKITLNRYSHVLKEMDTKASENISSVMFK